MRHSHSQFTYRHIESSEFAAIKVFGGGNMETAKTITIGVMALIIIWFGTAIIRLEQYRYAAMLSMCGEMESELDRVRLHMCLESKGSLRTSPLWDLVYGLDLIP